MKNSKFYLTLFALLATLISCGERATQQGQAKFSLNFDTSSLVSASTTTASNRPTDELYVVGKGTLEFFGIVVRDLGPSTITQDAAGTPVGVIIPPSSLMLTSWTNRAQLINILTTGTAEVNVTIPLGRNLSVTTYMVFIEDDTNVKGPGTLTTIFNVSQSINIAQTNQQVVLNVDTNAILDDAKPFVDWIGAFADSSGNVLTNTDVTLRHCKIGFEFSQTMFGANPEEDEKNFFRTDDRGWVQGVGISGVDFEIRAGTQIVKPCGQPSLEKNYPSGTPQVAFTGFKGATRYNDPAAFNTVLPLVAQNVVFNNATNTMINNLADDPDGDGLPTDQELAGSLTNPFVKNFSVPKAFDYQYAYFQNPIILAPDVYIDFVIPTAASCTGSSITLHPFAGSPAITDSLVAANDGAAEPNMQNCRISFTTDPTFASTPADGEYFYMLEIETNQTPLTTANGRSVPINLYRPIRVVQGSPQQAETITSPNVVGIYRNWIDDVISYYNLNNILPILDPNVDAEQQIVIRAADLTPGGFYFTAEDPSCAPKTKYEWINTQFEAPGVAVLNLHHKENIAKNYYLCHYKALNSTTTKLLSTLNMVVDPTRTYRTTINQTSSVVHGSPFTLNAMVYDSVNSKAVTCGLGNGLAEISVQNASGHQLIDISGTGLNATAVADPYAFIHHTSSLPTCAYYASTNDQIIFVSIDASNLASEPSPITFTAANTAGIRYAYRAGKLMTIRYNDVGQLKAFVYDIANSNTVVASSPSAIVGSMLMTSPSITSSGDYQYSLYDAGQVKTYRWTGSLFDLVGNASFSPLSTPVKVANATDSLGNTYILSISSPEGATLFRLNSDLTGINLFASSTAPIPNGEAWFGITKNRFTYTDAGQAKYFDSATSSFVNLMGDYILSDISLDTATAYFSGDNLYFSAYSQAEQIQSLLNMTVK